MTDQYRKCRHCQMFIPGDAGVCFHCKRSQGYFSAKSESVVAFIRVISIILSIALVTLSWLQFHEATKQRNLAENALREATAASVKAEQARDEIQNTVEHLRANVKLLLEVDYLTPKLVTSAYDPVKVRKVHQKLEEFAVPDEKERKKWRESLK